MAFFACNGGQRSKSRQVRFADAGDNADMRPGQRSQVTNLIIAVGCQFQNGQLVVWRHLARSDGQAVTPVDAALVAEDAARPASENGGDQFFGGCFAG